MENQCILVGSLLKVGATLEKKDSEVFFSSRTACFLYPRIPTDFCIRISFHENMLVFFLLSDDPISSIT
jgi:hypothetical protein